MSTTHTPSIETLKRALEIAEKIAELEVELVGVLDQAPIPSTFTPREEAKPRMKKRVVSAASRAKMAAAQRARWARKKAQ